MRPRGESISSFQSRYVGQVGRQKPQCTQASISFVDGASIGSNAEAAGRSEVTSHKSQVTSHKSEITNHKLLDRSSTGVEDPERVERALDGARDSSRVAQR